MPTKVEVELSLINKLTTGLAKASSDFKRFELNTNKSIAAIGAGWQKMLSLQNVFYGVGTGALIKSTVDASMAFQGMQNSMQAAVGQFTDANAELEKVRSESNRIGVDFERVAGDYIKFSASATRAGISLQKTRNIFKDLSETAVSLRLTPERTRLVFEALNQMASKGTVQMEELRGQLGDHIPAALNIAAKAMGMTSVEFYNAVKNGQVLAYDFIPKFAEQVRKEMGGGFEAATDQIQANLSRLKNSWFQFKVVLGDTFTPDLLEGVKMLTTELNNLSEKVGYIKLAFEALTTPFTILWNGIQLGIDGFMYLSEAVTTIIPSMMNRVKYGFDAITETFANWRDVVFDFFTSSTKVKTNPLTGAMWFDEETANNSKKVFEKAMAGFGPKARMQQIKDEAKATDDALSAMLEKYGSKVNKNVDDIANKLAKLEMAYINRNDPKKKGSAGGPFSPIPDPAVDDKAAQEALRRRQKYWEDYLELEKRWKQQIFDTQLMIDDANAESFRKKSTNRELRELEVRFEKIREKYKENNIALINIDEAYEIERKNVMNAQTRETKDRLEQTAAENLSILNIERTQYDQQLRLLEVKLKKEKEMYAGNQKAIWNLEEAFYIEQRVLQQRRLEDQQAATKSWVETVSSALITIVGENKKFIGLYKAASIAQIVADTMAAASSAYKSMVQSFGAYGIPAGVAAAGVVTAAGVARAAVVAKQKFGLGVREYRARGPQMIMVGDNPGGEETVTVRPTSSPSVNGPSGSSGGGDTHFHFYDQSGDLIETVRRKVRSGGADRLTRELLARGRMIGAMAW